jgi:hypothetical protein
MSLLVQVVSGVLRRQPATRAGLSAVSPSQVVPPEIPSNSARVDGRSRARVRPYRRDGAADAGSMSRPSKGCLHDEERTFNTATLVEILRRYLS